MRVEILSCGYCVHAEVVTKKGGSFDSVEFPSTVVVIEHPKHGICLFDTGYTNAFFEQTRRFPERLYAWVTPVSLTHEQTALIQLQKLGVQPRDVRHVILSHFHADHIAGLCDFPFAQFHYAESAYKPLQRMSRFRQVKNGFLRGLIPQDFLIRSSAYSDQQLSSSSTDCVPFATGLDMFGDGRMMLIPLPGHAPGHIGLLVRDGSQSALFIGDASWHESNFLENRPPMRLAISLLGDYPAYRSTLSRLKSFSESHPQTMIVPCHCTAATQRFQRFSDEGLVPS
jgi:glyoxylase-like metal-dependent hydrolase (beta-lactamase superfamily II)